MFLRPAEPDDVYGMQQLAGRVWPSGWHPGGLGWGLSRHALGDSVVVAGDEGRSDRSSDSLDAAATRSPTSTETVTTSPTLW